MSDQSEVVVVSSEEESESRHSINGDQCNDERVEVSVGSGSVVSVGDDDEDEDEESEDGDCEIVTVEDTRGEEKWRDVNGPFKMLNALLQAGHTDPRLLLTRMFGMDDRTVPNETSQQWGLLLSLLAEPTPRPRLPHVNTLEKVVELLHSSRFILVVTGAGISVSCGIPDFRSRDGIYARLAKDYPDLSSPQSMFDMSYFLQNPSPFFKFSKEIFPGQFAPSLTHRFVALLESKGKLLRNYTQNIDTLEQAAGITRLIQCHGSFATATCTSCKYRVPGEEIKETVFTQTIPYCPRCRPSDCTPNGNGSDPNSPGSGSAEPNGVPKPKKSNKKPKDPSFGVLKPDIVFFGEDLSVEFHDTLANDVEKADLVLVIGSSLKVRPVAHIPNSIPESVPQILINREPLTNHDFDVELLGDCDAIVQELCLRLDWKLSGATLSQPRKFVSIYDLLTEREKGGRQAKLGSNSPPLVKEAEKQGLLGGNQEQDTVSQPELSASTTDDHATSRLEHVNSSIPENSTEEPVEVEASDDSELDELWDVAAFLPSDSFTHIPPNQYVFPGAELFINQTELLDDNDEQQSGSCHTSPAPLHTHMNAETLSMTASEGPSSTRLSHFLRHNPGSSSTQHPTESTSTGGTHAPAPIPPCSPVGSCCGADNLQSEAVPSPTVPDQIIPTEQPNDSGPSNTSSQEASTLPNTATLSDGQTSSEMKRARLDVIAAPSCS